MNTRLRNRLSGLVVVISLASLAYALGELRRDGEVTEPSASNASRIALAMPFFSFGQRSATGAR